MILWSEERSIMERLKGMVEAILFAVGEAVSLELLAKTAGVDKKTMKKAIEELKLDYEREDRGIQLVELEDSYQLSTKKQYYEQLISLIKHPKKPVLTDVMLETLSIIAYKQPITRQEIEAIRGVKCSHVVNRLIEFGLVCEVGRLDAIGRPILFGTTEEFLRSFGVESIESLPLIEADKVVAFKQEAEEEVQLSLKTPAK